MGQLPRSLKQFPSQVLNSTRGYILNRCPIRTRYGSKPLKSKMDVLRCLLLPPLLHKNVYHILPSSTKYRFSFTPSPKLYSNHRRTYSPVYTITKPQHKQLLLLLLLLPLIPTLPPQLWKVLLKRQMKQYPQPMLLLLPQRKQHPTLQLPLLIPPQTPQPSWKVLPSFRLLQLRSNRLLPMI